MPSTRTITPGGALFPLRLFLGDTFVYAGYQKLSDPGFLHPGASTYIGTQLQGFASGTPLGFLLRWFALPDPTLAGLGVALGEIAIGLLVLLGLQTRLASAAGLGLNLVLFLTASWHTRPYFLGSDIVFVFAWLPFVLAGAQGQPALDGHLATLAAARRRRRPMHVYGERGPREASTRGDLLRRSLAATGAGTVAVATFALLMRGGYRKPTLGLAAEAGTATPHHHHRHHHTAASQQASTASSASSGPKLPTGAVRLGPSSALTDGHAATYQDPADGSPDIVIRGTDGRLTALSALCTHAGCQVGYEGGELICPCHGSRFSATTGAVLQGPAGSPLPSRRVVEQGGEIYAVPT